ncbi:ANTAR domain-containing protein [Flexivirga alba]|uniref:ANTAR domain-containing protein n=1 Tax=Flexivirga alba TaxID=702742 RepID=A0ABW2AJY6_9MICO
MINCNVLGTSWRGGRRPPPAADRHCPRAFLLLAGLLHTGAVDTRDGIHTPLSPTDPDAPSLLDLAPTVHQASGMVSVQLKTDTAAALDRLRSFATDHDIPLDEVAAHVVNRQLRFDDPE